MDNLRKSFSRADNKSKGEQLWLHVPGAPEAMHGRSATVDAAVRLGVAEAIRLLHETSPHDQTATRVLETSFQASVPGSPYEQDKTYDNGQHSSKQFAAPAGTNAVKQPTQAVEQSPASAQQSSEATFPAAYMTGPQPADLQVPQTTKPHENKPSYDLKADSANNQTAVDAVRRQLDGIYEEQAKQSMENA